MKREEYAYQNTARMEKILSTSATSGLTAAEAKSRLQRYGKNPVTPKRLPAILLFLKTVVEGGSLPLYLLALCLAAPHLGRAVLFPTVLYAAFLLVYGIFFVIREKRLYAHELSTLPYVRVLRDGKETRVLPTELVVGDLLLLEGGDILFAHAHVTTDAEMEVFCVRGEEKGYYIKHGGDCFDDTREPFNRLCPGDVIRSGAGRAFVTEHGEPDDLSTTAEAMTLKNHGDMCASVTRITFVLALALFAFGFFRTCFTADYAFLGECLLLSAVLIATASTSFYAVLFDLLFLSKNKILLKREGGAFVAVTDMEDAADVDAFVLSTRSLFLSARYVARYFEASSGRRVTEKADATAELTTIADALFAVRERTALSMKEEAILGFSARYASAEREIELYAKATDEWCTHASYRTLHDKRTFSLVWGDAERLIPGLLYATEDGRTRLFDAKQREALADGVANLKREGYHICLFAETQTRGARAGVPQAYADLRLLGFFAMRKCSDAQALRTVEELKGASQKAFFIHDGDSAEWLGGEIPALAGVPVIDGTRESFREELARFASDAAIPLCVGVHLSSLQKAQVVSALTSAGRRVAAAGTSFADHRMMCAATVSITTGDDEDACTSPVVKRTAGVYAKEHVTTQVETVRRASRMLSNFGVFTAALSASLIARTVIVLLGAIFGNTFLSSGWYTLLGIFLDILAILCFARAESDQPYEGIDGLMKENERNLGFFAGVLGGATLAALLATFVPAVAASSASFVFLTVILLLNVGLWYFCTAVRKSRLLPYSLASFAVLLVPYLLGWITDGRIGFSFAPAVLFWALFPIALLMLIGKLLSFYYDHKYTIKVGEKNE